MRMASERSLEWCSSRRSMPATRRASRRYWGVSSRVRRGSRCRPGRTARAARAAQRCAYSSNASGRSCPPSMRLDETGGSLFPPYLPPLGSRSHRRSSWAAWRRATDQRSARHVRGEGIPAAAWRGACGTSRGRVSLLPLPA
jgi:hypothetical protein